MTWHLKSRRPPDEVYLGNRWHHRSYTHIHIELDGYWLFACYGRTTESTLAKHMPELRRSLRNGCLHFQVDSVTGSGKSQAVPSVVAQEVRGKLLVLTPSTVDVTAETPIMDRVDMDAPDALAGEKLRLRKNKKIGKERCGNASSRRDRKQLRDLVPLVIGWEH